MLKLMEDLYLHPKIYQDTSFKTNREGFGRGLVAAGRKDKAVVGLCADLTESINMHFFAKMFPERFFEMGVAEQNMAGVAAGMALSSKIPFIASYAAFSPGRNFDQLRVSVAYSKNNVKIIGAHGGLSVGPDGATHQMLEDVAMMRTLPNMTVVIPADFNEAYKATVEAAMFSGPVYIRLSREEIPEVTTHKTPFKIGRAIVLKEGKDISLVAAGALVYECLIAAKELEKQNISAEVINCHTIKPLDRDTLLKSASKTRAVLTAEEAQINGGLGGAMAELLSENLPLPLKRVGTMDRFGESGPARVLMEAFGLTSPNIVRQAKELVKVKSK